MNCIRFTCVMLVLLAGNSLWATVIEQRHAAAEAYNSQQWLEAAELYSKLISANPNDGALLNNYGLALLRIGKYDDAIAAFTKSMRTGRRPEDCLYNIACAYSLSERKDQALSALSRAYAAGYSNDELIQSDGDLANIRSDKRFARIAGLPDPGVTDRVQRWKDDLDFLSRRVVELHWRPFKNISRTEFNRNIEDIVSRVSGLSDLQIRAEIQKLLVKIGDGHTAVVSDFFLMKHGLGHKNASLRFLPIELFWYDDAVRVIAATAEYKSLIGARVLSIDTLDIGSATELMESYVSRDNEWGARWGIMQALCDPKLLEALGMGNASGGFSFKLESMDGTRHDVQLVPSGLENLHRLRLDEALDLETPLRYEESDQFLWMKMLGHLLYVRIDAIHDEHNESFAEFTERIFTTAEENEAQALVIDLRNNLGGQGHLTMPLLHRLIASKSYNRPGALYVLIGRKTFSAAMALAAQLELHAHARFVGEPTGSRPNFVGESTIIRLPYSALRISISSRYHQNGYSFDRRFWIAPVIPAKPDFSLARRGVDPCLEAVMRECR